MPLKVLEPTPSLWMDAVPAPRFPPLTGDRHVDVVVVGGGVTGITTALMLVRAGCSVLVAEALRVGGGGTGGTTAHLSESVGMRYQALVRAHGVQRAAVVAEASRAGIEWMARTVWESHLNCAFQRVPGFLFTEHKRHVQCLEEEREVCASLGMGVELRKHAPLPFNHVAALRFSNQAQCHALHYLLPLADAVVEEGGEVYEDTQILDVQDGPRYRLETARGVITAEQVIIAAHAPLTRALVPARASQHQSFALAYPFHGVLPHGLYRDVEEPCHGVRLHSARGRTFLIAGGEEQRTGRVENAAGCYQRLHAWVRSRFSVGEPSHLWSARELAPADGMPLVGRLPSASQVLVATGYGANALTFGTAASLVLRDLVLGRSNPWAEVFNPCRSPPPSSLRQLVTDGVSLALHFVRQRMRPPEGAVTR